MWMPTTGPARLAYELDKASSLQDLRLAVSGQVVAERFHLAEARPRLHLRSVPTEAISGSQ